MCAADGNASGRNRVEVVPALTLRNGATIDDPLATALEFVAQDSSYALAPAPTQAGLPPSGVELFRDNDAGYLCWLAEHPHGFVLNAARSPRADYLILQSVPTTRSSSSRGQARRSGLPPGAAGSASATL